MDEPHIPGGCIACLRKAFCCGSPVYQMSRDRIDTANSEESRAESEDSERLEVSTTPIEDVALGKESDTMHCENIQTTDQQEVETTGNSTSDPSSLIDEKFLEFALRSEEPDVTVESFHLEPAVAPGENFVCVVSRAKIVTSHGPRDLILKCSPENELRAKIAKDLMIREVAIYGTTLPLLRGNDEKPNYPTYYPTLNDTNDILIIKDLKPLGYRTRDRRLGFDEIHCRLALIELAYLHGFSIALRIQDPTKFQTDIIDKYPDLLYLEQNREMVAGYYQVHFSALSEFVRTKLPYRFQIISEMMDEILADDMYGTLHKINNVPQSKDELDKAVLALQHGDFWANNILFQYVDGNEDPVACAPVDYQASRCASPAIDLLYMFYTSAARHLRRKRMDDLLQFYLDQVRIVLRSRGITDPGKRFYASLAELKQDMKTYAISAYTSACVVLPVVVANMEDYTDVPNIDEMSEDDFKNMTESPTQKLFQNPDFLIRFQEILEDLDEMGLFNERWEMKERKD